MREGDVVDIVIKDIVVVGVDLDFTHKIAVYIPGMGDVLVDLDFVKEHVPFRSRYFTHGVNQPMFWRSTAPGRVEYYDKGIKQWVSCSPGVKTEDLSFAQELDSNPVRYFEAGSIRWHSVGNKLSKSHLYNDKWEPWRESVYLTLDRFRDSVEYKMATEVFDPSWP